MLAIWSLVLGLLPLRAIPAISCGHLARSRIKRAAGALSGRGLALTGIILGYVGLMMQALIAVFFLLTSDMVSYALQCRRFPLQHEFVLEMEAQSDAGLAAHDALFWTQKILDERLRQAGIPHQISLGGQQRLTIQVGCPTGMTRDDIKRFLATVGFLEFRMVHPKNNELIRQLVARKQVPDGFTLVSVPDLGQGEHYRGGDYYRRDPARGGMNLTEEAVRESVTTFHAPPGYEMLLEKHRINGQTLYESYFVSRAAELKGDNLRSAGCEYDQMNRPYITLQFDKPTARKFWNLTKRYSAHGSENENPNLPRYLAIVLDGIIMSAPHLEDEIPNGQAIIRGNFTTAEAQELASVLRSGALPVRVKVLEEHSLGKHR
ncbi:MAG: DUF4190 domain-containing protein [Kiritimatiellaeota bacterium]|nr:DUF4190 domain-containing protein [Kiritimatiellota bacterium]